MLRPVRVVTTLPCVREASQIDSVACAPDAAHAHTATAISHRITTYRRRGFLVLAVDLRLVATFDAGGGAASYFLTSSTTSCHQCSAGPLSNPSSRRRVAENCGSWCQASQSARVLHVPTITRLSGLSDCRRSCPPTNPVVSSRPTDACASRCPT